ncbi:MFS transporter [Nocardioides marmoriginsengisoli]|uniref:MFS transporter n=1 Tax=Nocardioides marmoriginsengisoli TaxID=661483 RepID=A0A3N0CQV8_9ACTN|nr:MFS transporter [Nocardioides marmoriginsengisoli]RNL65416.1 MFS transporter [Nocardioides marmoriginsengisoli]
MTSDPLPPLTRRGVPIDPTLRVLALGTLINRAGAGALVTTFALFFTREVGLHPAQVGVALSLGALVGMLVQVPGGHLGDVRGPREVLRVATIATGVATLGLLVARPLWALIVVMALINAADAVSNSVRNGYVARIAVGGQGVRFKAYLRAITNVAMGLGALLGGVALAIDRPWAYLAVFVLDAGTSILAGLLFTRLPHLEPAPPRADGEPRLAVLRDAPFVLVTLLTGVVSMHFVVMEVGIPLWISEHTEAPTALVAVLLIINTSLVALFQVRLSLGSDTVARSAREMLRGALWIAGGFAVIGLTDGLARVAAIALLVVGSCVHVVGEMISSGGQWGVSMGLAPAERQGQYQGFAGLGFGLANVVAPTLVTLLCITWGRPGWFVMGGLIVGAAIALRPVTTWALATREKYGAATASG